MSEENEIVSNKRQYCPPNFVDKELATGEIMEGAWRQLASQNELFVDIRRLGSNNYNNIADAQRNILRDYFVSKIGESQTLAI